MSSSTFTTTHRSILSELVLFPSRNGRQIVAYVDCQSDQTSRVTQYVVLAPKYGETKKNNLQLAYQLAANGVCVLRFDLCCHVGESEGVMSAFTLPGMVDDICGAVDFLVNEYQAKEITLVANSLSARCALRAAAEDKRVRRLVTMVGVVNMHATLKEVYREDIFGTFLEGRHWGMTDILGFDINGETFLSTAVESELHSLAGSRRDAQRLKIPSHIFYAEEDIWVLSDEVRSVFAGVSSCSLVPISGAMHEIRENPEAAADVMRQVVQACVPDLALDAIQMPPKQLVLAQNRVERDRLRKSRPADESEHEFWSSYLEKYSLLEKADDYKAYLETLNSLLGRVQPGETLLDAGCGNGLVGLSLARSVPTLAPGELPPVYVGLDLTHSGLQDAAFRHGAGLRHVLGGQIGNGVSYQYSHFDFDWLSESVGPPPPHKRLPFRDGSFDRICCSLVLSYLRNPVDLLRELARVLRPGGILVFSSLKPYCDLSAIYRDFVEQQVTDEDVDKARNLLRAAGMIKLKEEKGHYVFLTEEEMAALAREVGLTPGRHRRSLGDQANLMQAQK